MKRKAEDNSSVPEFKRIKTSELTPSLKNFLANLKKIYQNNQEIKLVPIFDQSIENLCDILLKSTNSTLQAFYFALCEYKNSDSIEALTVLTKHPLFLKEFADITPMSITCMSMICHAFEDTANRVQPLCLLLENQLFFDEFIDYKKNFKNYHFFLAMTEDTRRYQFVVSALKYPQHLYNRIDFEVTASQHRPTFYTPTLISFWSKILEDLKCKDSNELKTVLIKAYTQALWREKSQFFSASMFSNQSFFNVLPRELGQKILADLINLTTEEAEEAFFIK